MVFTPFPDIFIIISKKKQTVNDVLSIFPIIDKLLLIQYTVPVSARNIAKGDAL